MIYPWQIDQWQIALQYLSNNRLPNAILISGASGIGKLHFCLYFIQRINCTQPTSGNYPCGTCKNCKLFNAQTHPDIRLINVEEEDNLIKVDEIREISQFISLSCQIGTYKILCINQAEKMNVNAANTLLKTLEEPPSNSVIFLITDRLSSLLATIKSRCQMWNYRLPNKKIAMDWLQNKSSSADWETLFCVAGCRPLYALDLHQTGVGKKRFSYYNAIVKLMHNKVTVTKISSHFQNEELNNLINWQQSWCFDLIRCHFGKEPVTLENPDFYRSLHSLVGKVDLQSLFHFLEKLIEFQRFSNAPLNSRLLIEDMLIQCQNTLEQPS